MQSLAAVVEDVRSGRRPPWPCRPQQFSVQDAASSRGEVFHRLTEVKAFGSNPGNLRMLTFVPSTLRASAPLVVVLHGCGQTAQDIARGAGWSALASECGFALLLPEQKPANNGQRGFNWFKPGDNSRNCGEALSIMQMVERMISDRDAGRRRIYVTGLSAGGAMTSALLAAYPEVFAGGAIVAGLPFGVASNVWHALAAMKGDSGLSAGALGGNVRAASRHGGPWPALSIWHGGADTVVCPSNADAIARQWCDVHGLLEESAIRSEDHRRIRRVWLDAAGLPVVEANIIPGMAHGAPIDLLGANGHAYGAAAPFFEDAGISSTYHIAKFWGLAPALSRRQTLIAENNRKVWRRMLDNNFAQA